MKPGAAPDGTAPRRPLTDLLFWAAVLAGPAAWTLLWAGANGLLGHGGSMEAARAALRWPPWPPRLWTASPYRFLLAIAVYPLLEEIVFRGGVQPWIRARLPLFRFTRPRAAALSLPRQRVLANILTSLLFALLHLYAHPPLWALATFFPSLVFGFCRDRYGSLGAPIALHMFYNTGYFALLG